jgi:hypothetical protein
MRFRHYPVIGKPKPGSVISKMIAGYWHRGVFTQHGTVIHNSKDLRCVIESSFEEFISNSQSVHWSYPSNSSPSAVEARARKALGLPYRLLTFNCEHLATWAHGLEPESPQIKLIASFAVAAAFLFVIAKAR